MKQHVVFLGAGAMAQALAAGFAQKHPSVTLTACAPSNRHRAWWEARSHHYEQGFDSIPDADIYILAVKPHGALDTAEALGKACDHPLLVSVAAGVSADDLSFACPGALVVRAMANLAAAVCMSMSGIYLPEQATAQSEKVVEFFAAVGEIMLLESEEQLHSFTALAGSSPGFFYDFGNALKDAAVASGYDQASATTIAKQTLVGAAHLAKSDPADFTNLADRITSPQGTTHAGRELLREQALHNTLIEAVKASTNRSRELGTLSKHG